MPSVEHPVEPRRITPAGKHFFFGYYERQAISADGRWHLALNPGFMDRPNSAADPAPLGVIDLQEECRWTPLEPEAAWNWQMGAAAQWLAPDAAGAFVCNVRRGDRAFARVRHVRGDVLRDHDRPLFAASRDGRYGISLSFARLHAERPGYGYPGLADPLLDEPAPDSDGLWRLDLADGRSELIVSLAQCRDFEPDPTMDGAVHRFNHVQISPTGTRLMFLHRWRRREEKRHRTRLFACRPDGSELTLVNRNPFISHCDWLDEERILSWCRFGSDPDPHYYLLTVGSDRAEVLGRELFDSDGHCCYNPRSAGRLFVTDTYPRDPERLRRLMIFDAASGTRYDLGAYRSPAAFGGEFRCDLHARWAPDGRRLSFDSLHEGYRAIYLVDVGELAG